mgnify:FL=1
MSEEQKNGEERTPEEEMADEFIRLAKRPDEWNALPEERQKELRETWFKVSREKTTKGEIHLKEPMHSRGEEVTVLHYDFAKLTNREFIACMDEDRGNRNRDLITRKQAMSLYSRMHDKVERPISGLDAHDLEEQACLDDMETMIDRASDFFQLLRLSAKMIR